MTPADRDTVVAFAAALGVSADGTVTLDGAAVGRVAGASDDQAALAAALMQIVYDRAYACDFPASARSDAAPQDLTAALAAANASRARTEQGWTSGTADSGGAMIATRHGRTRRFAPGQFVPADGVLPIPSGAPLVAHIPAGSPSAQPGFYYCFGEGYRDANDLAPMIRFYWNVRLAGATRFVTTLTALLNRYALPFDLKIATRSTDYDRRDNAVLYVAQDLFVAVSTLLLDAYPHFAGLLDSSVPLFTRAFAPGLGFAENPGDRDSFGMARSRLLAAALAAAREGAGFPIDAVERHLAEAIAAAGLRADALWLNPGAPDLYTRDARPEAA